MALLLFGCPAPPKPPCAPAVEAAPSLVRIDPSAYPNFADDLDYESLESASQSIAYLQKIPPPGSSSSAATAIRPDHPALPAALPGVHQGAPDRPDLQNTSRLLPRLSVVGRDQKGKCCSPLLRTAAQGPPFHQPRVPVPIFARPDDLLTIDLGAFSEKYKGEKLIGRTHEQTSSLPRPRESKKRGALRKAKPWPGSATPWTFFPAHPGLRKVILEDGQTLNLGYDTSNGRPYRSVGQLLIDEGKISREEMSMQRIRPT